MPNIIKTSYDIIEPYTKRLLRCRVDAGRMHFGLEAINLKVIANTPLAEGESPIDWIYKPKNIDGVMAFDLYQLVFASNKEIVIIYPTNVSNLAKIHENVMKLIRGINRIDMRLSIRTVPFVIETKGLDPNNLSVTIPDLTWSKELAEPGIVVGAFDVGVQLVKFRGNADVIGANVNF